MSRNALAGHVTARLMGGREREALAGLRQQVESSELDVAEEAELYAPTRDDIEQLGRTVARLAAAALGSEGGGR